MRRRSVGVVRGGRRAGRPEHGDDAHHSIARVLQAVHDARGQLDARSGARAAIRCPRACRTALAVEHVDDLVVGVKVVGGARGRDVADEVRRRARPPWSGSATIRNSRSVVAACASWSARRRTTVRAVVAVAAGVGDRGPGCGPRSRVSGCVPGVVEPVLLARRQVGAALGLELVVACRRSSSEPVPFSTNRTSSLGPVCRRADAPGSSSMIVCSSGGKSVPGPSVGRSRSASASPPVAGADEASTTWALTVSGGMAASSAPLYASGRVAVRARSLTRATGQTRIFGSRGSTPCNAPTAGSTTLKRRLQRDLGAGECPGNRARRLGLLRELRKLLAVDALNPADRVQVDAGDAEACVELLEA